MTGSVRPAKRLAELVCCSRREAAPDIAGDRLVQPTAATIGKTRISEVVRKYGREVSA